MKIQVREVSFSYLWADTNDGKEPRREKRRMPSRRHDLSQARKPEGDFYFHGQSVVRDREHEDFSLLPETPKTNSKDSLSPGVNVTGESSGEGRKGILRREKGGRGEKKRG